MSTSRENIALTYAENLGLNFELGLALKPGDLARAEADGQRLLRQRLEREAQEMLAATASR